MCNPFSLSAQICHLPKYMSLPKLMASLCIVFETAVANGQSSRLAWRPK